MPSDVEAVRTPVEILMRNLGSSPEGLGPREVERRRAVYGPNVLPHPPASRWYVEIARQLTHPLALLLWVAAGLSLVAGTPTLCWAILAVIAVNAAVALLQERQAARSISALERYLPLSARVRRRGVVTTIPAAEIVPGDVILISEGDLVSADARLLDGAIELDVSALTGESAPVSRVAGASDTAVRLVDSPDSVFSGATCTSGQAHALVFATGSATELGRIAALSQHGRHRDSPLERQVRRSAWLIAAVAVSAGLLFLPAGLLAGLSLSDALVFAVGLLVANVPEGLLPTITLALAVGVRVLARHGALVKRLSAVETLGSTTVICTDKTGTLTQNEMQVMALWAAGDDLSPDEPSPLVTRLAEVMASCNEIEVTADPMEHALEQAAARLGVTPAERVHTYRFDSRRKRMSVLCRTPRGLTLLVKGATEQLLVHCTEILTGTGPVPLTPDQRASVSSAVDRLGDAGLRVLALASRAADQEYADADLAERGLTLVGLVGLLDPPRPEVARAVADCHEAGVLIHVVTGDSGSTGREIARQVGIGTGRVVPGEDVDAMAETRLDELLAARQETVFARSSPETKLRIAEALRHNGEIVAMTGDGVNDAPALHRADIGVAMGRSGTDVARAAATMVLTDDNFATIVTAIKEGRRAYDNLRKFVLYIFAHAVPEVVPFLVFALSAGRVPLPLTVLQILAIDLGTETFPALALGRERAEPDVMQRPPRPAAEHLITGRLLWRAWGVMGSLSAVLAMGAFAAVLLRAGWRPGDAVGAASPLHHAYLQATTATFATIVACQVGTALAARTERAALASVGLWSNRVLLVAIGVELLFTAVVVWLPAAQDVFGTAGLPLWLVAALPLCSVLVWGADEAYRARQRRRR